MPTAASSVPDSTRGGVSSTLVLAWGNPSRGDDALGPALIERLRDTPDLDVDLLEDFQLQIEHCLDLAGHDRVCLVDAAAQGAEPFSFDPVGPTPSCSVTTHALSPGALLQVYHEVIGAEPPPCRVLAIRGYGFELGEGLSDGARANLEAATSHLIGWLTGEGV